LHFNINEIWIFSFISDSLHEKVDSIHEDFKMFKTEMKCEAVKNKTKMQEIFAILREKFPNEKNEEVDQDILLDFPLTSVEEYIQFNQNLRNDGQIRKYFVSTFWLNSIIHWFITGRLKFYIS